MSEERSKEFQIRIDEESPDAVFQDEIKNLRLEKLSKRVTIISILIPCFICILLILVYFDLRNKVTANQSTGVMNIQSVSKDFNTRLNELSSQLSKIEESLTSNISSYEKKISSLKFRIYKSENNIKKMNSSKADKKDQETFKNEINNFSAKLDSLDIIFSGKITGLSAEQNAIKKDLAKLSDDISSLSSQKKINRIFLENQLKKQEQNQQKELNKLEKEIEIKLLSMQDKLKEINKRLKLSGKVSQNPSKPVSPVKKPAKNIPEKPGKIIEKDL
jgi:DNA polymerase III alpha subunit (gram-positive type)